MQIIVTSALIGQYFEERKKEYIKGLSALINFGYKPLIVECFLNHGPCFLEEYGTVFYPKVNNVLLKNKGVNEGMAMSRALLHFGIGPGQTVKLTGRYVLKSPYFLQQASLMDFDCTLYYDYCGQVFTGCFAMDGNIMLQMYSSFDYARMEIEMINIEAMVAELVKNQHLKINKINKIGLGINVFGLGNDYHSLNAKEI